MNHSQFIWKTYISFRVPLGYQPDTIVVKHVFDISFSARGGRSRAV